MDKIMNIEEFKVGQLQTPIEGLLLRSDENGIMSIGIPVNATEVVIVAYSTTEEAFAKMTFWADKIDQVKKLYNGNNS